MKTAKSDVSQNDGVLFFDGRKDYAAIVTRVNEDETVNLMVLRDDQRNPHTLGLGFAEFIDSAPRGEEILQTTGDFRIGSWRLSTTERPTPKKVATPTAPIKGAPTAHFLV